MSLETYGRYQLIKKIATGGMAQIYLARQVGPEGFEKLLVLKRILPHLAENRDFITMFLDEARIAARLNHPNIVQIFDLGAQDDSYFIAMEYIHGEDARRVWKQSERDGRPIPQSLICRIVIEACAGLDYAHKKTDASGRPLNIVHRDISPQNILVSFEGGVKIVDFGIAKAADQATVTRSGVLKGKYSYMSPEQAAGQPIDHRTDIFALGVVLWELLTGARLFKRTTDLQTLNAVTDCKVVPPSTHNSQIMPELDAIVLKALAKDRSARFQEAKHLAAALEDWMLKNQLPSSTAQLAEFMHDIYADRIKQEAEEGRLLVETMEAEASRNEDDGDRPPTPADEGPRKTRSYRGSATFNTAKSRPDLTAAERPEKGERPSRTHRQTTGQSAPSLPRARGAASPAPVPSNDFRHTVELPAPSTRPSGRVSPVPAAPPTSASTGTTTAYMPPSSQPTLPDPQVAASPPRPLPPPPSGSPVPVPSPAARLRPRRKKQPRGQTGLIIGVGAAALLVVAVAARSLVLGRFGAPEVHLTTSPSGATLTLDGAEVCVTPCTLHLPAGSHELAFEKTGFEALRTSFVVPERGSVEPAPYVLTPTQTSGGEQNGSLVTVTIDSQPTQARLFINDAEVGLTPHSLALPAEALATVRLELEGYASLVDRFKVTASLGPKNYSLRPAKSSGKTTNPSGPKEDSKLTGTVRFIVKPWAVVECPPYKFGETPFADQTLAAGEYRCRFKNDEGERVRTIKVESGKLLKVLVDFAQ